MFLEKICSLLKLIGLRLVILGVLILIIGELGIFLVVTLEVIFVVLDHGSKDWVEGYYNNLV